MVLVICIIDFEKISLPDFLRPKFEEDCHDFADIEFQAKLSKAKLNIVEIDSADY